MNDIVIPYLKSDSGELELCVKLIKKNFPHRKIHIVQYEPEIRLAPHRDVMLKLQWAIDNLELTEDFYLFNDDFFCMKPVKSLKYYYRSTLKEHISERRYMDTYKKALIDTKPYGDISYELHIPFKFNKTKLYKLLYDINPRSNRDSPLIRSAYGNVYKVGGTRMNDVKNIEDYNSTFLSTTNKSFTGEIGDYIRSKV